MSNISDNVLIALVVATIIVSLAGTVSVNNKLNDFGGFSVTGKATSTPSGQANVTIPALTYISLPVASIDFGTLEIGESNDTSDSSPAPFQLQNDGTVNVNVTIGASDLFSSSANPSSAYTFKSRVNEANSVLNSTTDLIASYTNMPQTGSPVKVATNLRFPNAFDNVYVDINVTVPSDEAAGAKSSTVTFTATQA